MRIQSTLLPLVLSLVACGAGSAAQSPAATPQPVSASAVVAPPQKPTSAETLAEADQAYLSQLGASRGGRFDTERQINALRQAVLLYSQFLERAAGHPEMEIAMKKSRERRSDALDIIAFLEASLREPAP